MLPFQGPSYATAFIYYLSSLPDCEIINGKFHVSIHIYKPTD